jgi:hypothetical protein
MQAVGEQASTGRERDHDPQAINYSAAAHISCTKAQHKASCRRIRKSPYTVGMGVITKSILP